MKSFKTWFNAVLGGLALMLAAPGVLRADDPACLVLANVFPPFFYTDQQGPAGFGLEVLRELKDVPGLDLSACDVNEVGFVRGLKELERQPARVMLNVARTPEREDLLTWVGPYYSLRMSLIGNEDKDLDLTTFEDLKGLRIATIRGTAPEEILLRNGVDPTRLDRLTNVANALKMLETDRVDLFAHVLPSSIFEMKRLGIDHTRYRSLFPLGATDLYFALNRKEDPSTIKAMQAALNEITANRERPGSPYARLVEEYALGDRKSDTALQPE